MAELLTFLFIMSEIIHNKPLMPIYLNIMPKSVSLCVKEEAVTMRYWLIQQLTKAHLSNVVLTV